MHVIRWYVEIFFAMVALTFSVYVGLSFWCLGMAICKRFDKDAE